MGQSQEKLGEVGILEKRLRAGLVIFCSFIYASFFFTISLLTSNDEGWRIEDRMELWKYNRMK